MCIDLRCRQTVLHMLAYEDERIRKPGGIDGVDFRGSALHNSSRIDLPDDWLSGKPWIVDQFHERTHRNTANLHRVWIDAGYHWLRKSAHEHIVVKAEYGDLMRNVDSAALAHLEQLPCTPMPAEGWRRMPRSSRLMGERWRNEPCPEWSYRLRSCLRIAIATASARFAAPSFA